MTLKTPLLTFAVMRYGGSWRFYVNALSNQIWMRLFNFEFLIYRRSPRFEDFGLPPFEDVNWKYGVGI